MRLEIRRRRLEVSGGLRAHIERRIWAALGRFARQVAGVWVYLCDVNGPRGGVDKRCRIVVQLARGGRAVAGGIGTDPYAVVANTAARSARVVKRNFQRSVASRSRLRGRREPSRAAR